MKRIIVGILIFLVLGVVTSVAIAWACTLDTPYFEHYERITAPEHLYRYIRSRPWAESVAVREFDEFDSQEKELPMVNRSIPVWSEAARLMDVDQMPAWDFAAGCPMLCLEFSARREGTLTEWPWNKRFSGAIPGRTPYDSEMRYLGSNLYLPYRPIVLGLLVNTLVYGAMWFAPFAAWSAFKRRRARRRTQRGLCVRCVYPIAKTDAQICSECGAVRGDIPVFWRSRGLGWFGAIATIFALGLIGWVVAFHADRLEAPLHMAAALGDLERVDELLAAGANPNEIIGSPGLHEYENTQFRFSHSRGHLLTPLDCSMNGDHLDVSLRLLEAGAIPHFAGGRATTPLHNACAGGDAELVRAMIKHGGDPTIRFDFIGTAAGDAARGGHIEVIHALRESGVNLGAVNDGLENACWSGDLEMCRLFLDAGLKVTPEAMHNAVRHDKLEVFELMLANGGLLTSVDKYGGTLLHNPVSRPILEAYGQQIIDAGVNVNTQQRYGYTALHLAAWEGNTAYVRFLLNHGADPTIHKGGSTPFDMTSEDDGEIRALLKAAMER